MTRQLPEAQAGFALAEVLVAFAIVSLTLIALHQGVGLALRGMRAADDRAEALSLARSRLGRLGLDEPLRAGTREGAYPDGRTWRLDATPLAAGGKASWSMLRPYRVRLALGSKGSGGRGIVLETILLAGEADADTE